MQNSTSLGAKIEAQNNARDWTPSLLRHEARLQFGAPIWGSKLDPVSVPFFGFKIAPASENVSHLPRDKFSVDRSHFASCMSPMVTSANSSHSSLRPLQNQRERLNQKRNSNCMYSDPRHALQHTRLWQRFLFSLDNRAVVTRIAPGLHISASARVIEVGSLRMRRKSDVSFFLTRTSLRG